MRTKPVAHNDERPEIDAATKPTGKRAKTGRRVGAFFLREMFSRKQTQ